MNHLRRELAPVSDAAWAEIDAEAKRVLTSRLAARRVVDLVGPLGMEVAAVNLGRLECLPTGPTEQVGAARRVAMPLLELTSVFELSRFELDAIERGAKDPDLAPLIAAAQRVALAEDTIVFRGFEAGGMKGIVPSSTHEPIAISANYEEYPRAVAEAARVLRTVGVEEPYSICLGPRCYAGITQATAKGGYPILEIIRNIVKGSVIWAPAVDGAVVLSARGGDFELVVGEDLSIGYKGHDDAKVQLFLTEGLAFRVLTPEAAVALQYR